MELDTSRLFNGHRGIDVSVMPMDFPFLITHAFDDPRRHPGVYVPDALCVVLAKCCELMVDETANPQHLRDMLKRGLKADASESGMLGLDKLSLDELFHGRGYVSTVIGMTATKVRLRRYGDCLAIRPINDQGETHEKMANVLTRLAEDGRGFVRPFIQRYSFALTPVMKGTSGVYVFNAQDELTVMDRYLPDIKWAGSKRLNADFGADFTSHQRTGVKVGSYGDAEIFARIVYEREVDDRDWRRGKVRSATGDELSFGYGTGDKPRIEYFIQIVERDTFDPARADIDYQREQGVLHDLARMLYAGLFQREFQSMIDHGNEHHLRFRRESEKVAD